MKIQRTLLKAHPATLVLASFLLAIVVGTFLLKMPISSTAGRLPWIDALFTSTSAVCVTGLVVVDTGSYFTAFGKGVILVLIQVGGLGVMTISVFLFQWLGRSVTFRQRMAMQDLFAHTPRQDILGLVKSILLFTLAAETIGSLLLWGHWSRELPAHGALFTAVFHAVSAFCNAGFSLYPDSMVRYRGDLLLNTTMCGLIMIGGIGFPVLFDLQSWWTNRKRQRIRLSIQTKTVLVTTALLIASGALMFAILEGPASDGPTPFLHRLLPPIFQSVTCRTAGFNTVDIASLRDPTLALMIFLMFVGASPGSCGGGVKTTTLALLTVFTLSRVRRKKRVNLFRKSVPNDTITRSVSLVLVSVGIICIVLFLILLGEPVHASPADCPRGLFLGYLFETVSAFGTVGLSMGVTPLLGTWGKILITLMMLVGRVGVLTFSYIIVGTAITRGVEYAEENLMVG